MSATSDYQRDVKARGWVYLSQLPYNTPLGRKVEGAPGARSPWSPNGSKYELAPLAVRIEQGFANLFTSIENRIALSDLAAAEEIETDVNAVKALLTKTAEATGLDHGVSGVLGKALGVPPWVMVILVLCAVLLVARQYRVIPPLKEVIK